MCQLTVSEVDTPVTCPSGSSLNQVAVLVRKGEDYLAACDIRLTNEAWADEITIRVKATTDQLYDGDHTASLSLQSQFITQEETVPEQLLDSAVSS